MNIATEMNVPCTIRPEALLPYIPEGLCRNVSPGIPWTFRFGRCVQLCVEREGQREVLRMERAHEGQIY